MTDNNSNNSNDNIDDNDVLLGRGGATNNHVGNKRFRMVVSKFQEEYLKARKKDKALIAKRIVEIVHRYGGRFLKRDEASTAWIEVADKRATEKTSQALREGLDVRNQTIRPLKPHNNNNRDSDSVSSIPTRKHQHRTTSNIHAPNSPALVSLSGCELPELDEETPINVVGAAAYQAPPISADDCDNVVEV